MNQSFRIKVFLIAVLVTATSGLAFGQPFFTETFSTSSYNDVTATTADWDTGTGELKLFPFISTLLGSDGSLTTPQRVTVEGDYAYVGCGNSNLKIVDISNPTAPVLVSSYNTLGYTRGVDVVGNLLYVAAGLTGLRIMDISDPASPSLVGYYDTSDFSWDVAVDGNYAYVADSAGGLKVIDVTDPSTPSLAGSYNTAGNSYGVAVDGDHVYLADGVSGLHSFDVSDPTTPVPLSSYNTTGYCRKVVLSGHKAYTADTSSGMFVIDISDPTSLSFIASYNTLGSVENIDIEGDRAYLADGSNGLVVLDISDPSTPALVETVSVSSDVRGVSMSGHHAILADNSAGLLVVQVADLVELAIAGDLFLGQSTGEIVASGNRIVMAKSTGIMRFVDITDPANPVETSSYNHTDGIYDIEVADNYVYASDDSGLSIIDISNPALPVVVGDVGLVSTNRGLTVSGNHAYLATEDYGMVILNIANPLTPYFVTQYYTADILVDVVVTGDTAYALAESGQLRLIDISNEASPSLISSYNTGNTCADLEVVGNHVFVAMKYNGLRIYDVSNPASISLVGTSSTTGWTSDISVDGNIVVLAAGASGARMIDITDITAPQFMTSYDPNTVYDVDIAGQYAYISEQTRMTVMKIYQDDADTQNNLVQSTSRPIYDDAFAIRIQPVETGTVDWEVSPDHGSTWFPVSSDAWTPFGSSGRFLRWRSILNWASGVETIVDSVKVEWLNEFARISDIHDIPEDQGGQVRLAWLRSGRDFIGDSQQITEYAVYRRVDTNLKRSPNLTALVGESFSVQEHAELMAATGWDYVTTVPVRVEDEYSVVVPTLADSSIVGGQRHSIYMVSAMTATPGVFFDSPPDSGYSVDNLAPNAPVALVAAYQANQVVLDWDDAPEFDFRYFRVYRSTDPAFVPGQANLVKEVATSAWTDPSIGAWDYHYKVTTVDFAGNESAAGETTISTGVSDINPIGNYVLNDAAPNPFNPTTVLSFALPSRSNVDLGIYDLSGRLVRSLVQESMEAGEHQVTWDGRDSKNEQASSGVYLYRIEAGSFRAMKRMTLLK